MKSDLTLVIPLHCCSELDITWLVMVSWNNKLIKA